MKYRMRKSFNLLPFLRVNVTQAGRWSFTWHLGPWSYNTRLGQHRIDTPGPGGLVGKTRAQRERARRAADSR